MLHAGLDLSRHRLDVRILDDDGRSVAELRVAPEGPELRRLAARYLAHGEVRGVIESMNGARFVHDQLELAGWEVEIADAQKVKGLAPLARQTDKIDAWVLAELSRRDLVPAAYARICRRTSPACCRRRSTTTPTASRSQPTRRVWLLRSPTS